MKSNYVINENTLTDYSNIAESELNTNVKSIEEIAQDMALKAHIRWEEIQVEKATTEQLLKAKQIIDNELLKRKVI